MIIGCPRSASGVKRVHRVADRISRESEHALIDDDDGDFAIGDRFASAVLDLDINFRLAAGCECFVARVS